MYGCKRLVTEGNTGATIFEICALPIRSRPQNASQRPSLNPIPFFAFWQTTGTPSRAGNLPGTLIAHAPIREISAETGMRQFAGIRT